MPSAESKREPGAKVLARLGHTAPSAVGSMAVAARKRLSSLALREPANWMRGDTALTPSMARTFARKASSMAKSMVSGVERTLAR